MDDTSPTAWAVEARDHVELLRLLEAGADPNSADEDGLPLLEACGDDTEIFALLVRFGARVHEADADGRTWLHRCSMSKDGDPRLQSLLGRVVVDAADRDGWTPLHLAASCGYVTSSSVLLSAGADPKRLTNRGLSAVDLAVVNGHNAVAAILNDQHR